MQRSVLIGLAVSLLAGTAIVSLPANSAMAQQPMTPPMVLVAQPQRMQADLGGGFIEFLFGDNGRQQQYAPPSRVAYFCPTSQQFYPNVPTCQVPWQPMNY